MEVEGRELSPPSRQVVPAGLVLSVLAFSFLFVMFVTERPRGRPATHVTGTGAAVYGLYSGDSLVGWASVSKPRSLHGTGGEADLVTCLTQVRVISGAGRPVTLEVETGYTDGPGEVTFCRIRRSEGRSARVVECRFTRDTILWRERRTGTEITDERTVPMPRGGVVVLEDLVLGHWQRLVQRVPLDDPAATTLTTFQPETCTFSRVTCVPMGEEYRSIAGEKKPCLAMQLNSTDFAYVDPETHVIEELDLAERHVTFVREGPSVIDRLPRASEEGEAIVPEP